MTPPRLQLGEYQSAPVELSEAAARDVAESASGRLAVALGSTPGEYFITASQWVGSLVTADLEVIVRPKVPLHNLFTMLDVIAPGDVWSEADVALAEDPELLTAIAMWFARLADQAVARGVRRDYVRMHERVPALRGRIDFPAQLRRPAMELPLACSFDEYTADIIENQVLQAAARRLLRMPMVGPDVRRSLHRLLIALEEVGDVYVDADAIDRIVITRLNRHYKPALGLARLILRGASLLDRFGSTVSSAFMVDMNALFQAWVTDRLHRHLRERFDVRGEPKRWYLDVDRKVRIEPDLVFATYDGAVVGVGDVKYKITDSGLGRTGDYYQLLAYTTAREFDDGILVYCLGDGQPVPRQVTVLGSGKRLHTWRLDLAGSSADLERSVGELADFVAEMVAA